MRQGGSREEQHDTIMAARGQFGVLLRTVLEKQGKSWKAMASACALQSDRVLSFVYQAYTGKGAPAVVIDALVPVLNQWNDALPVADRIDSKELSAVAAVARQPLPSSIVMHRETMEPRVKRARVRNTSLPALPSELEAAPIQEKNGAEKVPVMESDAHDDAETPLQKLIGQASSAMDISIEQWVRLLGRLGTACSAEDFERIEEGAVLPPARLITCVVGLCKTWNARGGDRQIDSRLIDEVTASLRQANSHGNAK